MPTLIQNILPARYSLSCGSAFFRLWEQERGLIAEIPPCVVTDKETGEVKLYGAEAASLEGRVPNHLEFHRLWWADKIQDREKLRLLLQLVLESEVAGGVERWRRPWQTQVLLPESMLPLHRRWLERTAREAGWWLPASVPAHAGLLKSGLSARSSSASNWRIQSFLDIGFSHTRFVAYVGREVLLAVSTESLSLSRFCQEITEYLADRHGLEIPVSSFYDQNWSRTRLAFQRKNQKPTEWSLEGKELQQQQERLWQQVSQWLGEQLQPLSIPHRTEIEQREIVVVGGGASLWNGMEPKAFPYLFRRTSDAPYAQLRASFE